MNKLLHLILGIPPGIPFHKLKAFDSSVPVMTEYPRSVRKSIMWLMLLIGIIIYMNTIESSHKWVDGLSDSIQSPFERFSAFLLEGDNPSSEYRAFSALVSIVGFTVSFLLTWMPILLLTLTCAVRGIFEMFPHLRNPRIPN